jgi:hypothetical protein
MIKVRMHPSYKAEKTYCLDVLFVHWLGLKYHLDFHDLHEYHCILPDGKQLILADVMSENDGMTSWCVEKNLPKAKIETFVSGLKQPMVSLYGTDLIEVDENGIRLGADLIATIFFMLTRWEESVATETDPLGRLPFATHAAARFGFAQEPILDHCIKCIHQILLDFGYITPLHKQTFKFQLSCDVDIPLQWPKVFGRVKTVFGAAFKRNDIEEVKYWLKRPYLSEHQADPCDTFSHLMDLGEEVNSAVQFNFLGDRPSHFDHHYPIQSPFIGQLIHQIKERGHLIGFHPSVQAAHNAAIFASEYKSVCKASGVQVQSGRHHYLAAKVPESWQLWESNGLSQDSSLGYFDAIGFRCGTCRAFPLFDFKQGKKLELIQLPLIAMDVASMIDKNPDEALAALQNLKETVEKHAGVFTLLWHNSSFFTYRWYSYRDIPQKLITNHD